MIALALSLILICGAEAAPSASPKDLAPGIGWTEGRMDGTPVHVLRIRPGAAQWRFLRSTAPGGSQRVDDLPDDGPLVAFNSGYFDVDGSPMGLMVHEGTEINPMRKADWGVFWIDKKGRGHLHHRRKFRWPCWREKVDFAVECGPRVRVKGEAVKVRPGAARRTLVGIRGDGDLVLAVFPSRVDLRVAGRWLHSEWEVVDLLNLDGGSSTQLALRDGSLWRVLAKGVKVPVLIGLYPSSVGSGKED